MKVQSNEVSRPRLILLVALLFGLIIVLHMAAALAGTPFLRSMHLGTALEYAHGRIDLLRPIIVGYDATDTPIAQELPVWQAAAAIAFKVTGSTWYGWANVVSLLLFSTALWPFFQLARQYAGERAAWWSLAFFLAQPIIIINAGSAATDGFCLVVTIWFLFFADKMIRSGKAVWWIPTAFFAALSAVSKLPFFMAVGLCSIFLLLINGVRTWRPWFLLASAGFVAAVAFGIWTRYANSLSAQAVYPMMELRFAYSPFMRFWFLGNLHYRLSPGPWIRGGWRFLHGTLGSLPLVALLALALFRPGNRMAKLWLLATFLTTLVFTTVVLEHWHYYLMCCPAVALLCGATLVRWEGFWAQEMPAAWLRFVLAALVLILSGIEGVIAMKPAPDLDHYSERMSNIIREHTQPGDKLVLYDLGLHLWGDEKLMRSGRKGLCVQYLDPMPSDPNVKCLRELLNNETDLNRLKSLGYNKLVLVSESPVEFAAQAIDPGSHHQNRSCYPATLGPKVDAWPVVYQSEDILIKQIP